MDPVFTGTLSNPQTLNRYAYAGENLVTLVDPSGLIWGRRTGGAFLASIGGEIAAGGTEAAAVIGGAAWVPGLVLIVAGGVLMYYGARLIW